MTALNIWAPLRLNFFICKNQVYVSLYIICNLLKALHQVTITSLKHFLLLTQLIRHLTKLPFMPICLPTLKQTFQHIIFYDLMKSWSIGARVTMRTTECSRYLDLECMYSPGQSLFQPVAGQCRNRCWWAGRWFVLCTWFWWLGFQHWYSRCTSNVGRPCVHPDASEWFWRD